MNGGRLLGGRMGSNGNRLGVCRRVNGWPIGEVYIYMYRCFAIE